MGRAFCMKKNNWLRELIFLPYRIFKNDNIKFSATILLYTSQRILITQKVISNSLTRKKENNISCTCSIKHCVSSKVKANTQYYFRGYHNE